MWQGAAYERLVCLPALLVPVPFAGALHGGNGPRVGLHTRRFAALEGDRGVVEPVEPVDDRGERLHLRRPFGQGRRLRLGVLGGRGGLLRVLVVVGEGGDVAGVAREAVDQLKQSEGMSFATPEVVDVDATILEVGA